MNRSSVRRRASVPRVSTQKSQTKDYEFTGGLDTKSSNDDVNSDKWRYITDAREVEVGKWETRRGNSILHIPAGGVTNASVTSTTGASTFSFSATTRFAQKVTSATIISGATGLPTIGFEVNIRNTTDATGTIVIALYTNDGGSPGTELVRTTIAASRLTSSYQYLRAYCMTCPDVGSVVDYWIVGWVQDGGTGSYEISTTTSASTGKTSTNAGVTWGSQSYAFNVKLLTATNGSSKGCYRVTRNGTTYSFLAHDQYLYTVNETTGALTAISSSVNTATTDIRFEYVNDVLYWVENGAAVKPHKYDFTSMFTITTAPENANNLISHAGLVFYMSADDSSKVFYTNFGLYDTFTSTDFLYVPAPKTGDPLKAFAKLNGALYMITRNNKFILSGKENATFQLDNAIGQKGTFSQESTAFDENYIYLASDSGIYRFNGAEETNIARDVLDWWEELLVKDNTVLELFNNRLYVFYTPNGESQNSRCKVYNTLYGVWESDDTRCYVSHTYVSADQTNYFLQTSNRAGMLMYGEWNVNEYNMLGEPLSFELRTPYNHYGTPAQLKRAPLYRPHFDSVEGNYGITVGYATDYSDAPTESVIPLAGNGPRFNEGYLFDNGEVFGGTAQINPMSDAPLIPGEWRRLQLRYSHEAAREPVSFDGHVLTIETQRIQ